MDTQKIKGWIKKNGIAIVNGVCLAGAVAAGYYVGQKVLTKDLNQGMYNLMQNGFLTLTKPENGTLIAMHDFNEWKEVTRKVYNK